LLFFPACGSDDFRAVGGVPLDEVPARYAETLCEAFESCAGAVAEIFFASEDCETLLRRQSEDELPALEEAIDAGTLRYDPEAIDACFARVRELGCESAEQRDIPECDDALLGLVPIGESCRSEVECEPGSYCKTDNACPGVCSARETVGGDCGVDDHCEGGLGCSGGTCEELGGSGDACNEGEPACGPGLFCLGVNQDEGTPGQCEPLDSAFAGEQGDPCGFNGASLCESDLVCVVTSFIPLASSCERPVGSGQPCPVSFPDACPADEYCDGGGAAAVLEGLCTPKPEPGEPCAAPLGAPGSMICSAFARCVDGECVELERNGGSCEADVACYTNNCLGGECAPQGVCD
jgi:hypothetical protein